MSYQVRILRRAQRDLEEIQTYSAGDSRFASAAAATAMTLRLIDRIESLGEFPDRGARPRDESLRRKGYRFLIERPYLIFYKVQESRVLIYRVVHGKRAYERIL